MTLSVTQTSDHASPMRGLMPLWVGVGVYALFLLAGAVWPLAARAQQPLLRIAITRR